METLRGGRDFRRALKGKRVETETLIGCVSRRKEPAGEVRFGWVVSRSVGGAVVRNRVRRRLRSLARDAEPRFKKGSDCVVIARPPAAVAPYGALASDFEKACGLAGGSPS